MTKRQPVEEEKEDHPLVDRIAFVILFADDADMEAWFLTKDENVNKLMETYKPRLHRCLFNKTTRQITVITGRQE